ncbi:carboxylesterase/lipase family protein [Nonomuraea sediminis]|uniref:carboxylesterase/lipase family protein n=1 Tax=Nonomuraea sediminis TaxID=2835864 RepID=UPI001BDCDF16|nr:carboxylesterase family protein [Nonomuraea sediminis]
MTTITTGRIRGLEEDGVAVFKGIPYARSPFGALRLAAPVPAEPWDGVRDALAFGPRPPQPPLFAGMPAWDPADGLDCLTVNVWTPDAGGSGLPVMVWIYGGGYVTGSADMPEYDGTRLARECVVVVTFNHRVGFEGYGHVDGAPDNRALLDQVLALQWVRDNIAAFGGDPGNVTIFGESAGAGAVACLLAMPSAAGLFRRAIAQSVPGMFFTPRYAAKVTRALLGLAGAGTPYEVAPEAAAEAAGQLASGEMRGDPERWGTIAFAPTPFAPVVDGEVLPDTPWNALADGAGSDVELITGYNRDEYLLFQLMSGGRTGELGAALKTLAPADADVVYRTAHPQASDAELLVMLMSDWMFRMPSALLADAHTGPTFAYELTWAPQPELGACHGLDVPLTFGTVHGQLAALTIGGSPHAEDLSRQFRTAWTRFAATGDPGWPAYDPVTATTHLFDVEPRDVPDPEAASRALWSEPGFPPVDG